MLGISWPSCIFEQNV